MIITGGNVDKKTSARGVRNSSAARVQHYRAAVHFRVELLYNVQSGKCGGFIAIYIK